MMQPYCEAYGVFDCSKEPILLTGLSTDRSEAIDWAKDYNNGDDMKVYKIEILKSTRPVKL